ncbi:hypothetical protein ALC57_11574 [Trachymyrmex cornetzi]|uniref:Uncharacterized protein n=1 Tax=Trachymyrmex cornetzi TaxID=471704 RepID=A0A151J2A1_9HYME|nr:hypothetical protein ALC57_11574 [Trachymyrmex cornetzi]
MTLTSESSIAPLFQDIDVQVNSTDIIQKFSNFIKNERDLSTVTTLICLYCYIFIGKIMIGVALDGSIIYVSKVWGERASDIDEICAKNDWKLIRSPFFKDKKQLSKTESIMPRQRPNRIFTAPRSCSVFGGTSSARSTSNAIDAFEPSIERRNTTRDTIKTLHRENFRLSRPDDQHRTMNVTYGRTLNDVRELRDRPVGYLRLKDARSLIPEIDEHSRQKMQEFISASTYAMEKINYAEKPAVLKEILNTKLKGKLLLDFQTRSIRDFEQLRREIEDNYLGKRGTSHLQ